jgi:hypothetical protein
MAWPPRSIPGTGVSLQRSVAPGYKNPAIEQLPASSEGVVTVNGSGVEIQSDNCRIFTGSYTGDGSTSQAITCPGAGSSATIRYLRIWQRQPSSGYSLHIWEATREINDDIAAGMGVQPSYQTSGQDNTGMSFALSDTIIALGTDGTFTVDDGGSDRHPNKNSEVYNYYALGT